MTNQNEVSQYKKNGTKPKWYFSKRRPNSRARNSQVEKFFKSDAVEDLANAIVREGIQNSLDAGISFSGNGKTINIQIGFGECSLSRVEEFFPGLFDHLKAVRKKIPGVPQVSESLKFLTFEDFNTTGLRGDPSAWDPEGEECCHPLKIVVR